MTYDNDSSIIIKYGGIKYFKQLMSKKPLLPTPHLSFYTRAYKVNKVLKPIKKLTKKFHSKAYKVCVFYKL